MEYLFVLTLLITILVVRIYIFLNFNNNIFIGKFEVHHYLSGLVLSLIATLVFPWGSVIQLLLLGIGSGLVVDEIGFELVSGTDDAYYGRLIPLAISMTCVVVIVLALLYIY